MLDLCEKAERCVILNETWDDIPEHLRAGLQRYIEQHILPGSFLVGVLTNNLKEAVCRADTASLAGLPALVRYLCNYVDPEIWGDAHRVAGWLYLDDAPDREFGT